MLSLRALGKKLEIGQSKLREILRIAEPFEVLKLNKRFWRVRESEVDAWIAKGCPLPSEAEVTTRAIHWRLNPRRKEQAGGNGAPAKVKAKATHPAKAEA